MSSGADPQIEALAERIAARRASVAALKAERARVQESPAPPHPDDAALAALREQVTTARARLAELEKAPKTATQSVLESAMRRGLYVAGTCIALPGAVTDALMLRAMLRSPDEHFDLMTFFVISIPLLLGLALIARARFANYRPDRQDLDGDFLA